MNPSTSTEQGMELAKRLAGELVGLTTQRSPVQILPSQSPQSDYPAGIGFRRLGEVTLVNVARADHPLARFSSVSFAQLADHTKLSTAAQSRKVTTSEYLKSPRQWLVHSELALLELLDGGLGWAAVPRRMVAESLASGKLVELALEAYPFTQWNVGLDLIWNSAAKPGKAATWLRVELGTVKVFR